MQEVTLKNGAVEADVMVSVTMLSLESLMKENPIAFYEAAMVSRDRGHVPFGNTGNILKDRSILQSDGSMHDSIRNILLSAIEGDGLDMCLVSPIAQPPENEA